MTNSIIYNILAIAGALVIFLIGMKLMSEALQKVSGTGMRRTFSAFTSSPFKGILTGFIITGSLQSSSAISVMIVSFVNAGLLNVSGAISVIFGANIGTTITAWLVSLVGFRMNIAAISLPLIGISFPLYFSKNNQRKAWGEIIVGFALLFLGLQFMKDLIPDIENYTLANTYLNDLKDRGFLSILIFFSIGMVLTALMQSSSAVMALTMVMAFNGIISYELAASMIIGENVGTTMTTNIASLVANKAGKTVARSHFLFNAIGACIALALIHPFLHFIDFIAQTFNIDTLSINLQNIGEGKLENNTLPIKLSLLHTGFNVFTTLLLVPFIPQLQKMSSKLFTNDNTSNKKSELNHINSGILSNSEISIIQAKNEISVFSEKLIRMFKLIPELLHEKRETPYKKLYKTITNYEQISDDMEAEIANYLSSITEKDISKRESLQVRSMLKMIDDMESIADRILSIAKLIDSKNQQKAWFNQYHRNRIQDIYKLIEQALTNMHNNISKDRVNVALDTSLELEAKINALRDTILSENIENLNNKEYPYISGNYFVNIISSFEKIGDHILNVTEAMYLPNRKRKY